MAIIVNINQENMSTTAAILFAWSAITYMFNKMTFYAYWKYTRWAVALQLITATLYIIEINKI